MKKEPVLYMQLRPCDYNLVPVETDKFGMRSDLLLKYMQQWCPDDVTNPQSNIPKLIYTIPTCGNPTGVSAGIERKKEIYEVNLLKCMALQYCVLNSSPSMIN